MLLRTLSEMLLKQFSSVFSTPIDNHAIHDIQSFFHDNDQIHSNLNTKLTDIIFTRESVEAAIKSLKANSAPGPDGMTIIVNFYQNVLLLLVNL